MGDTLRRYKKYDDDLTRKHRPWHERHRIFMVVVIIGAIVFFILSGIYTAHLDNVVTQKFEGKKWAIPAKVYASPLELYEGKRLSIDVLETQLVQQGYQKVKQVVVPGSYSRSGSTLVLYSRGFQFPDSMEASQYARITFSGNTITGVSGQNKKKEPLSVIRLDPQMIGGIYPASYEDRLLVRLEDVPDALPETLVAVEDRDFYSHFGISPTAILRALVVNVSAGSVVQGGSTLTQQLVKNFFLSNERTLLRKVNEAIMSVLLEWHYDKDELLETYLNEVYLGQQGRLSIHGFGLASEFYFAQPLQEIGLEKIALLVALVKGPSWYDPRRYPERAMERRNLVLHMMEKQRILDQDEVDALSGKPLGIVSKQQMKTSAFPAYLDLVKQQLKDDYREEDLTSEGLRIFTNLDPVIQRQAQGSVSSMLEVIDKDQEKALQGSMIVTSAQMGAVLAVVGDRHAGYAGFNRAVYAKRQVGSLIKPAIYLTALEDADHYTLTTPLDDSSISVENGINGEWTPHNDDGISHGIVPLYRGLAKSYNRATVRLGMNIGIDQVLDTVKALGIKQQFPAYPSVLLGAVSLSPYNMASMYQTIASGGFRMPLRAIEAVMDAEGQPLKRYGIAVKRVISTENIALLRYGLALTMKEGTGRRAYQRIDSSVELGGKSGTSDEQRDSWFAGFSGNLMAVAWVGYDDNRKTHLYGSSGALPVWSDFMAHMPLESVKSLDSKQLEYHWVDPQKNIAIDPDCPQARKFPYIKGSEPDYSGRCGEAVGSGGSPSLMDRFKSWFD
ncbi:Penicillin-binding protein 1B [invertebrate metagenome]|uniref:Penicillin-binding protein 1B n=1 Tax=invertebrate metagenome TaxID=1711999 RepID=A0A2H9T6Z5_9ZZZZ